MIYAPHDMATNPDSVKRYLAVVPSVVLNTSNNQLVLLPLMNRFVIKQGNLVLNDQLNIMTIDGEAYDELAQLLELTEPDHHEVERHYFVERCNQASGYGTRSLSDTAYQNIYDLMADSGDSIVDMLSNMHRILNSYYGDSAERILDNADIEHENMPQDDKVSAAIDSIIDNDYQTFHFSYFLDEGKPTERVEILYSAS